MAVVQLKEERFMRRERIAVWRLIVSILLVICMILPINTTARAGQNFNMNFSLSGNGASDIVAVARAQIGKTGAQLAYTDQWCAMFVGDCARMANQSRAIPYNANCVQLQKAILNAGGRQISLSEAQMGDIVFYGTNGGSHVEIVYAHNGSTISSIGGNSGNFSSYQTRMVRDHATQSMTITKVLRPNYSSSPAILPGTVDSTWNVPVNVTAGYKIQTYDAWGNVESGHYIDPGDNCYIEAVYTNGFARVKYPTSSGDRWAYAKAADFTLSKKVTDKINLRVWFSNAKMGNPVSETTTGKSLYLCYEMTYASTGARIGNNNGSSYSVVEKVYDPDGSVVHTCTYDNDNNWIGITPGKDGRYTGSVLVSGGVSVQQSVYINVNYDASIKTSPGSLQLTLNQNNSGTINVTADGACPSPMYFSCDYDDNALETSWGAWSGTTVPLTVKAKKPGTYKIDIDLRESGTGKIVKSTEVTVNVSCQHVWGAWTKVSEPTCTKYGTEKITCTICGTEETRDIPNIDHNYVEIESVRGETCDDESYTVYQCTYCGARYKISASFAFGHIFDEWSVTKAADCTNNGVKTRKCKNCPKTETEIIKAKGHKYAATVVQPTCTTKGYTLHKCSVCGDTYIDLYTDVVEHKYSSKWSVDRKPTCSEEGMKSHHCLVCGAATRKTAIAKTAHMYDKGTVIKKPTTSAEGQKLFICVNCSTAKIEKIAKLHTKKNGLIKHANGKYYYYKNDKIQKKYVGLVKKGSNWFYVKNGTWMSKATGMVKHTNGHYYYVKAGRARLNFTGFVYKSGKYFYFSRGIWRSKYTSIATVSGNKYYIVKGVKSVRTGNIKVGGKIYKIVKGRVR